MISCDMRPEGKLGTNVKNLVFMNLYSLKIGEKGIIA